MPRSNTTSSRRLNCHPRRLRVESLENRSMLSVATLLSAASTDGVSSASALLATLPVDSLIQISPDTSSSSSEVTTATIPASAADAALAQENTEAGLGTSSTPTLSDSSTTPSDSGSYSTPDNTDIDGVPSSTTPSDTSSPTLYTMPTYSETYTAPATPSSPGTAWSSPNTAPIAWGSGMEWYANEDQGEIRIPMGLLFHDGEQWSALQYSVVSSDHPEMIQSVTFDGTDMVVVTTANSWGEVHFVIRGTDDGGLFADGALTLEVASVNDAPTIVEFLAQEESGWNWTFVGQVADVDGAAGIEVRLGGLLEGYNLSARTGSDGRFVISGVFPRLPSGTVTAQATDPEGTLSEVAMYFLRPTV